jgi:hypothetical protein
MTLRAGSACRTSGRWRASPTERPTVARGWARRRAGTVRRCRCRAHSGRARMCSRTCSGTGRRARSCGRRAMGEPNGDALVRLRDGRVVRVPPFALRRYRDVAKPRHGTRRRTAWLALAGTLLLAVPAAVLVLAGRSWSGGAHGASAVRRAEGGRRRAARDARGPQWRGAPRRGPPALRGEPAADSRQRQQRRRRGRRDRQRRAARRGHGGDPSLRPRARRARGGVDERALDAARPAAGRHPVTRGRRLVRGPRR